MKKLFIFLFLTISISAFSQNLSWENPKMSIKDKTYTLIDIDKWGNAIIKYERVIDDRIIESGTFYNDLEDGVWTLYNENGLILSTIKFKKGKKIWMRSYTNDKNIHIIYKDNKVSEVTYYLAQN